MTTVTVLPAGTATDERGLTRLLAEGEQVGGFTCLSRFSATEPITIREDLPEGQRIVWLFDGDLAVTDSTDGDSAITTGEVAVISGGEGLSFSLRAQPSLDGIYLALNGKADDMGTEYFWPEPQRMNDHEVAVLIGELSGAESPLDVSWPATAAEIRFTSEEPLVLDVPEDWEFAVWSISGDIDVAGSTISTDQVAYVSAGSDELVLTTNANPGQVIRAIIIGGKPQD